MTTIDVSLSTKELPSYLKSSSPLHWNNDSVCIHIEGHESEQSLTTIRRCARKISASVSASIQLMGDWSMEQQWAFASSVGSPKASVKLSFSDASSAQELSYLNDVHKAFDFARDLVNQTPEQMSPSSLADQVERFISGCGGVGAEYLTAKRLTGKELLEHQWHGIYEVGRGSERPPVLLELDYNPTGQADAPVDIALVGKGITFDSGGYSIKSSEGMLDMKCDMGGAATVSGALALAIMQGVKKRIKLFLCCAENLISGHAYKLGDIITYKNGTSVEIVNTDAEGRLVLADGLMAATESQAKMIVDAATLTGAAVMAVGRDYNAVFSLDTALQKQFLAMSDSVNEPHWPLPLSHSHKHNCPSPFADTANSRPQKGGGAGGASNAAGFLSRFVREDGQGWLHIDLAAAYNRNGSDTMVPGATGIGIRSIAALLLETA
ncbi:aminopeptidase PepB [Ningiella sp. W23]|uniref:aminopeptidase PepB n=1 Tax=Ningiella sp. W23 TaxID=3023715 RepID=UPI003757EC54